MAKGSDRGEKEERTEEKVRSPPARTGVPPATDAAEKTGVPL
ncbi:unnamed protein product [Linum tenue]|uniref:Uncharacterized protein n=1 Tax=Linum tenue TaxID=586396 RepID=A0AAV0R0Y8_9ROSI|nr:unnamed protein product [Linum tenue]